MKVIYPPADPKHLCDCPCHKQSYIMHDRACCIRCICGNPIKEECCNEHVKACRPLDHKDHPQ